MEENVIEKEPTEEVKEVKPLPIQALSGGNLPEFAGGFAKSSYAVEAQRIKEAAQERKDRYEHYGFRDAVGDAVTLANGGFSLLSGIYENSKTPLAYEEGFSLQSEKALEMFEVYGVPLSLIPNISGTVANYRALEEKLYNINKDMELHKNLGENFPIAQYPMYLGAALLDPVDMIAGFGAGKLVGVGKTMNRLHTLGTSAKLAVVGSTAATASEVALQQAKGITDYDELGQVALYSAAFGGAIGVPVGWLTKSPPDVFARAFDSIDPSKFDLDHIKITENFLSPPVGTTAKVVPINKWTISPQAFEESSLFSFKGIKDLDETGKIQSPLGYASFTPITGLLRSDNPKVRLLGSKLDSPAIAMRNPVTGDLALSPDSALNMKRRYEGISHVAMRDVHQAFKKATTSGEFKGSFGDFTLEQGASYNAKLNRLDIEAHNHVYGLSDVAKERRLARVMSPEKLEEHKIMKELLLDEATSPALTKAENAKALKALHELEDFEHSLLVRTVKSENVKTLRLTDAELATQRYFKTMELEGKRIGHSKFRNLDGNTYFPRVYKTDRMSAEMPEATEALMQALSSHPTSQREINRIYQTTKLSKAEAEKKIRDEIRKIAVNIIEQMRENTVLRGMDVKDVLSNPKTYGSMGIRKLDIDESYMSKYLNTNIEEVMGAYSYKNSGKFGLKESLGVESKEDFRKLVQESGAGSKERSNLEVLYQDIIGQRSVADNPHHLSNTLARMAVKYNDITMAGKFGINTLYEIGPIIASTGVHGIKHLIPAIQDVVKMYRRNPTSALHNDIMFMGHAGHIYTSNVARKYSEVGSFSLGGVEGLMDKARHLMYHASGLNFIHTVNEIIAGAGTMSMLVSYSRILGQGKKLSNGKLKEMARMGLSAEDVRMLGKEVGDNIKYDKRGRITELNLNKWANQAYAKKIQRAISENIRSAVVQGDVSTLPAWFSNPNKIVTKLMFQYVRFGIASHEKVLLRTLDEFSMRHVMGTLTSLSLFVGMTALLEEAYVALGAIKENKRKFDITNPDHYINFGRASMTKLPQVGAFDTIMNYTSFFTGIKNPVESYDARTLASDVGGITFSQLERFRSTMQNIASDDEISKSSTNFIRSAIPFQSIPPIDLTARIIQEMYHDTKK